MTDWLTPEQRADWETLPGTPLALVTWHQLYRHAAEADRRLAEKDDMIREMAEVILGFEFNERGHTIEGCSDLGRRIERTIRPLAEKLRKIGAA